MQTGDELATKLKELEDLLKSERSGTQTLQSDYAKPKDESQRLVDEVTDLQARSILDNLLFFNVQEKQSNNKRKNADCSKTLRDFMKNKLRICDADSSKTDRVIASH